MTKICSHSVIFGSLCAICGKPVDSKMTTATASIVGPGGAVLKIATEEAEVIQATKLNQLRKARKLALVLDLDHTLLHAVQVDGPTPPETVCHNGEIHHLPIQELSSTRVMKHLVMKKRPHVDRFLQEASNYFQMSIYTMGTRRYAEAVVKILDPNNLYFNSRIVARSEGTSNTNEIYDKSLKNIFLDDASMAVILDDRDDVWKGPQNDQLLLVRPYIYFIPGGQALLEISSNGEISEVNNSPGASGALTDGNSPTPSGQAPVITLLKTPQMCSGTVVNMAMQNSPEFTEADDQLLRCLDILKELHRKYFTIYDSNLKNGVNNQADMMVTTTTTTSSWTSETMNQQPLIRSNSDDASSIASLRDQTNKLKLLPEKLSIASLLNETKSSILAGCTITFSGLIAKNESHPEKNILWKLALALGAQVSLELLPRTTHLVALNDATEKAKVCLRTRKHNVWVVHPDWLIYCRWSLSKALETTFSLFAIEVPPMITLDYTVLIEESKYRKRKLHDDIDNNKDDEDEEIPSPPPTPIHDNEIESNDLEHDPVRKKSRLLKSPPASIPSVLAGSSNFNSRGPGPILTLMDFEDSEDDEDSNIDRSDYSIQEAYEEADEEDSYYHQQILVDDGDDDEHNDDYEHQESAEELEADDEDDNESNCFNSAVIRGYEEDFAKYSDDEDDEGEERGEVGREIDLDGDDRNALLNTSFRSNLVDDDDEDDDEEDNLYDEAADLRLHRRVLSELSDHSPVNSPTNSEHTTPRDSANNSPSSFH